MKPENFLKKAFFLAATGAALLGCGPSIDNETEAVGDAAEASVEAFYGTDNPYASEAVYFLLTDRFVDGDPGNNQADQGEGEFHTFDRPLHGPEGKTANIGYLGGDFKGVIDNAQYIKDMGFTSVWLTPIFDNPDAAFSGGDKVEYGLYYRDGGKSGYHGYWGVNYHKVDEHLESPDLDFEQFVSRLREDYQLKFVLDVVGNHGSPAYTMPTSQPEFGKLYDGAGRLVADHENLHPHDLDPDNPLHAFYNREPGLAELSDLNENNPDVLDYFVSAYLKRLQQGAHAIRIDTIKEMPHHFWKRFTARIREHYPDIFIFGESYSYDADFIAEHTRPENGGVSVLDFPGREAMIGVFENPDSDYSSILSYLHLTDGVYENPYELMTFYDNHDMARMNATDKGFIDANNWLFTSRGIPVIYYGSEVNFMTGTMEHEGNRNYLGQARIDQAVNHPVRQALSKIAHVRKDAVSLQKGLQLNLEFKGNLASFYRIYQKDGVNQTALVLLNKGDEAADISVHKWLNTGSWRDAISGEQIEIRDIGEPFTAGVEGHGVRVFLLDEQLTNPELIEQVAALK